ncbi:FtsX-like permease family protein [candidate division WWE3 bacterium]|uniref:FtsX-like permease family protein n=1 Tax=candidate division WWE3 bacterium TaxID=2053526 RepID=A0A7X9E6F8_UNCKA|nr:FtsX-like permease family protein [candidate division WWE3 bacterium]
MRLIEIFEESISVLKTNGMRTALSALGIIIGIGSVITLMTLGQASQQSVKNRIQSLGSNLLIVRPGAQRSGFLRGSASGNTTLKYSDAKAIEASQRINTIQKVAAEYSSRTQLVYGRNNTNIQVSGVTGEYFDSRNITLTVGSPITEQQNQNMEKVVVLGPTVVEDLFGTNVNPIGKSIRINGTSFTVVGVTKSKGSSGVGNSDDIAYVPLQTAQKVLFGVDYISTIYVTAKNDDLMEAAQNQLGFLLLELHNKATPSDADFTVSSQADILETATEVTSTFTTLLTGIAAISLIVGGIGIMNIMLVTVTERTMEIGLRMSLGAKSRTIITQFLTEAVVLTITGGMLGVLIGVGASTIITKAMSLPTAISYQSIVLSVVVSCLIGIIFGWYPAYKASKLQPIEALRYE